jgi:hypothetical protein
MADDTDDDGLAANIAAFRALDEALDLSPIGDAGDLIAKARTGRLSGEVSDEVARLVALDLEWDWQLSQREIARRIGRSQSWVSRALAQRRQWLAFVAEQPEDMPPELVYARYLARYDPPRLRRWLGEDAIAEALRRRNEDR